MSTRRPLLAQIPDLSVDDSESLLEEHAAAASGRLISQALASKLVLGGGILLVVAAILPFTMAKTTHSKPADSGLAQYQSTPAPDADVAPGWSGDGQSVADHSTTSGSAVPQRSVVVEAVPASLGANVQAPVNLPAQMPQTASEPRGLSPRLPTQGGSPGDGSRQAATGPTDPAAGRPVYQADQRNDWRNTYRSDYRGSEAPGVNPVMPDLNREIAPQGPGATPPPPATPAPSAPASEQQPPPANTARLDGIIPIPPNQDHP
jgi:hypothetical protein